MRCVVAGRLKPSLRALIVESSEGYLRNLGVESHGREVVVLLGRLRILDLGGLHLDQEMNESP